MNAQLRELLREARCPNTFGGHPDPCGWCTSRAEALATLAAPKEAGDAEILALAESVEVIADERGRSGARADAGCLETAATLIRRLAAPSKEAGAVSGQFPAPIRNPEAWPERYADGYNDALQHVIDLGFAAPQADQQGASQEGVKVKWPDADFSGTAKAARWNAARAACIGAYHAALASKASPDDQRQEGVVARMIDSGDGMGTPKVEWLSPGYRPPVGTHLFASPPTEAAAAVGGLLALALEIESRSFRDIIDDDLVRWSRQIKDAALSPTASAAREGSK